MIVAAYTVAAFFLLMGVTMIGYTVVAHVKPIVETEKRLGGNIWWAWRAVTWLCAAVAIPGDIIWNATIGTYVFQELPKWFQRRPELMFSARVKRHYNGPPGARRLTASTWRDRLNEIWPGHIR